MFAALSKPSEALKDSYNANLRNAFVIAISIHILVLVFSPPFKFRPYVLATPDEPIIVTNVPDIVIPPPPRDVTPPHVVIPMDSDDDGEDVKLAPSLVDTFPPAHDTKGSQPTGRPFIVFDSLPVLIHAAKPAYSQLAREAGMEGTVLVKVVVSKEGKVVEASVLSSDVTPDMENAAIKAARQCRFEPAKQGNIAVDAAVVMTFDFRLE